jgi:two-component system response regulator CpxR
MLETRGYTVVACSNGKDALAAFDKGGIDLILSDLMMPELDGAELVRRMKGREPSIPAIIFSGKIKIYDKDMQADVFLPKGMYAPAELLERIRVLLVRKRGPKKTVTESPAAEMSAAS